MFIVGFVNYMYVSLYMYVRYIQFMHITHVYIHLSHSTK